MTTRIMVVDDEPAIGKLLLYQLTGFGYQVSYFQDGLEALRRLPAARPDLVLLDVMMPLISGWEVCRQIRTCSAVPIIMLTAKSADADVVAGLGAGADDYVTKPFSMAQLHARIEAVLRRAAPAAGLRALTRTPPRVDTYLAGSAAEAHPPRLRAAEETSLPVAPETSPPGAETRLRLSQHLRETRIARGMTLHQIERATGVRWEFLQAIEQENWSYIPRDKLRHALRRYAAHLGIELPGRMPRPAARAHQALLPIQFAAAFALVLVLLVVGMYFL